MVEKFNRQTQGEHGRAFTEVVIVLPLFMLIVFGTIDFSRMLTFHTQLVDAAMQAGREASLEENNCLAALNPLIQQYWDRYSLGGTAPRVAGGQIVTPAFLPDSSMNTERELRFQLEAELPCMTCSLILSSSLDTLSINRSFSFPIENPANCSS